MCVLWVWWGVVMVSALPAGGQNEWVGGTRERAVPTKSWNVRPEWNSCCTLCPDCLTACDSRENNRINNHSHTPSLLLWKIERLPLTPLPAVDSENSWNFPYFSPALHHKTWKFPAARFWAVSSAANGKPQEDWGRGRACRRCVWCRAKPNTATMRGDCNMGI